MDNDVANTMIKNGYSVIDLKRVGNDYTLYTFEYDDSITKKFSKDDLGKFKGKVTFTKALSMFL